MFIWAGKKKKGILDREHQEQSLRSTKDKGMWSMGKKWEVWMDRQNGAQCQKAMSIQCGVQTRVLGVLGQSKSLLLSPSRKYERV